MKAKLPYILVVQICMVIFPIRGQTINKGELYVSPKATFSISDDFHNSDSAEFYNDGKTYINAGFHNDGIVYFLDTTSSIRTTLFIGNRPQQISGNGIFNFYNIKFNNRSTGAFQLSGEINAHGQVNFKNGIVEIDSSGGRFTFMENATHTNTSNYSFVDGPVEKFGNTDFIYPIGDDGQYRFAGISAPGISKSFYSAQYFLENSNLKYPHQLKEEIIEIIDDREYWVIKPSFNGKKSLMITLSWDEATTPQEIIAEPQEKNIHIVRWDVEDNMWVDEGGLVDTGNKTVTTAVDEYGIFTLARVRSEDILPCQIVVYNAVTPNGDGINDYLRIKQGINGCARNIHVKIFNRWSLKVYETNNYGINGNLFRGYSEDRLTLQNDMHLPTGTYFYILTFKYDKGSGVRTYTKVGYLYLNSN